SGEAISASCSFLIAMAETTLSVSFCAINSKSLVTSSAGNGSNFSICRRIISGNSAGSTLGRRKRCAITAETGKPRTNSSLAESSGTASSNVCSLRTVHEPFCSVVPAATSPAPPLLCEDLRAGNDAGAVERTKFQPLEVGMMKIDGISVWMLKFLPTEHLRTANACCLLKHYHLH